MGVGFDAVARSSHSCDQPDRVTQGPARFKTRGRGNRAPRRYDLAMAPVHEMTETKRLNEVRDEARAWFRDHWEPSLTLGAWWSMLAESGGGFPTWPEGRFGRSVTSDEACS